MPKKTLRIMHLGPLSALDSINNILCFYKKDYDITVVNTHPCRFYKEVPDLAEFGIHLGVSNLYEGKGFKSYFKRRLLRYSKMMASFQIGNCYDRETAVKLAELINKEHINLVFAEWGTVIVPKIALVSSLNLNKYVPIVHNIITYPDTTNRAKGWLVDRLYANVITEIDGLLFSTHKMKEYMLQRFSSLLRYQPPKSLVYFQRYCFSCFYKERLKRLSSYDKEPHIVFLGRTDFSNKRPIDNVRQKLREIARERIHIHYAKSVSMSADSEYMHPFNSFSRFELLDGKFSTFMTQFDAAIVLYNVDRETTRFNNSLPNRFLFALTAGIPIVVQQGLFPGCKEVINEYGIGFAYDDYSDLRNKLCDSRYLKSCREMALSSKEKFIYEDNFDVLENFFGNLVITNDR